METQIQKERMGTITRWTARGFGYISCGHGSEQEDFYLHVSEVKGKPEYGATVTFNVDPIRRGRLRSAIAAVIVEGGAL
jgi:cold shock CspA family protein